MVVDHPYLREVLFPAVSCLSVWRRRDFEKMTAAIDSCLVMK